MSQLELDDLPLRSRSKAKLAFHRAQAELLEVAFRADLAVMYVVGTRLGRDIAEMRRLQYQVLPQLSVQARLKLLRDLMTEESWDDDFPFVVPVLDRLFTIRNTLAHSYTADQSTDEDGDWSFTQWSFGRSGERSTTLSLVQIRAIAESAKQILSDLDFIWIRAMPESFWLDETEVPSSAAKPVAPAP